MALETRLRSFPQGFRALIIGSSGAIGSAFAGLLRTDPGCGAVVCISRHSLPMIDYANESSISSAAAAFADQPPFHLIINAAGVLHAAEFMPEKKFSDLNYTQMVTSFTVNAFGPALAMRHFLKLLDPHRGVFAVISAKVGSIGDNRLGGWYSYRASKAALNMFLKTASIESRRVNPNSVLVALHPGTVNSNLSEPFRGAQIGRPPDAAAGDMLRVIDSLTPAETGCFYSYDGAQLPW